MRGKMLVPVLQMYCVPVVLLFQVLQATDLVDYSGYQLIGVDHHLEDNQIKLLSDKVEFWTSPRQNGSEVSFTVSPVHRKVVERYLADQGVEFAVRIPDLQEYILQEKEANTGYNQTKHYAKRETLWEMFKGWSTLYTPGISNQRKISKDELLVLNIDNYLDQGHQNKVIEDLSRNMDWIRYHRLATINSWLSSLATKYSDIVELVTLGVTAEQRKIVAVKIGTKGEAEKPGIFIEGGIHAREWISPASVTYVINELVLNPENKDLIEAFDFYIVPVLNPDGYEYSHQVDRMWRKNRKVDQSFINTLTQCRGVDLNRNFGYNWGEIGILDSPKQGTPLPCFETYIGSNPFSEIETQAIKNFILTRPGKFIAYLSIHSFGGKILYPWSYTDKKVSDWQDLHYMGHLMAEAVAKESGGRELYKVGTASDVQYTATGGSDDWARGGAGIKYVYLVELPGKGQGFLLPQEWIPQVSRSTFVMVQTLARTIAHRENQNS